MKIQVSMFGQKYGIYLSKKEYHNGCLAILASTDDGEPFATISTLLPESENLDKDSFYVKNWSENEEVVDQLIKQGVLIVDRKAPVVATGFVLVAAYKLNEKYVH